VSGKIITNRKDLTFIPNKGNLPSIQMTKAETIAATLSQIAQPMSQRQILRKHLTILAL
jgi:hypothetical protein